MSDVARIIVPCGWKRNIESSRSAVIYVSPSGAALSSIVEVFQYLEKDDTCKCGLSCPIHVPKVFSFNPDIETMYYTKEEWIKYRNKTDIRMNKCQHWLKLRKTQKGKTKISTSKPSAAEPPPKLLIIRKDGKLRSVIPDASSSEKYKQSGGTDASKRSPKSTETAVKKANEGTDLKLALSSHSPSVQSSANTSITSPLKFPLFEPTTTKSAAGGNVKSKLQWIKADFETPGNDAESDTELCFSPDFKRSPTTPLPQSFISGFVSPSKFDGLDAGARSMPTKSFGDGMSRFAVHPNQDGSFLGIKPVNFTYMGDSVYGPPNFSQGNARNEHLSQSNQIRHTSSAIASNPRFGGIALLEQGHRNSSHTHTLSDDKRQMFANDGASVLHQTTAHHSNHTGNMFNMNSNTQATPTQQRLPLGSPPLLNPVSPYNFQLSNNGMMVPLGSPGGTNPSPYSNRSQSRSSSVGAPALSPGGIWPGPRHVTDSSRPMSRSSSTATPGSDVSPGSSMSQWNGNVANSGNYTARTPSCSFLPVVSPGPISSFSTRFPTLPSTFSRFPQDNTSASSPSNFHQTPYPNEYAASQRLRMHSQTNHQQHAQRFEMSSRFRHYNPAQSAFGSNTQFPVLMSGAPQRVSHRPSESVHQNALRPTPPYQPPKFQPSRMCEPDVITHSKFPFNSNQFNPQTAQQETGNIVQHQLAHQQWQYNTTMTPRQYFAQNTIHPRAPVTSMQRPPLRPPKPKRTRKRKPKNVPNKEEPPTNISTIKSEFPEIFDSQDLSGLIPTSGLLLGGVKDEVGTETMKCATTGNIQENSTSTLSPSLVLPVEIATPSVSSDQLTRVDPSSPLHSEKASNDEISFTKDLLDTEKLDCCERDVTTPPLPVLSPVCLMDNMESPGGGTFPDLDFGGTTSSNLLALNMMTSIDTVDSCVSEQCLTPDTVSSSSTPIKNSATVQVNMCTETFPLAAECSLPASSVEKIELSTSAISSFQEASVFSEAASSAVSLSETTFAVSTSLTNFSSFMYTNKGLGFQSGSIGVTSLVSSSGTLFNIPDLSKSKSTCIHRRWSYQSPTCDSSSRRRYFSEPWQSCMSATTSKSVPFSANPSGVVAAFNSFDKDNEIEKLMPPLPHLKLLAPVVSTMKCSDDSVVSLRENTVISNTSKEQSLPETSISSSPLHKLGSPDPLCDSNAATVFELTVSSDETKCIIDEPKNHYDGQKFNQSSSEDAPNASLAFPEENVNEEVSYLSASPSPFSTVETEDIGNTVKEVVMRLVEEASSIKFNDHRDYKDEHSCSTSNEVTRSSPCDSSSDLTSQQCKDGSVAHRKDPCKLLGDCQPLGNESNVQSSVVKQTEAMDNSTVNNVEILNNSEVVAPTDNELYNICAQIGLDDLAKDKDIGIVFANSAESSDKTSSIMTEEKGEGASGSSKIIESSSTPMQIDANCSEIESDHSLHVTDDTTSCNAETSLIDKLCDGDMAQGTNTCLSDSVSASPSTSKDAKFGDHDELFMPTCKSDNTQEPIQNSCHLMTFPASLCASEREPEADVEQVPVLPTPSGGGDCVDTNPVPVEASYCKNTISESNAKWKETISAGTNVSYDNTTDSQISSGYCDIGGPKSINMPPEWTTTVIQQLSSYNRILKNLLVRQVSPTAADIAQMASGSPNRDAKQADVISALLSNTVPQMTSAEIFHKTAIAMHASPTMPVLPTKCQQPESQSFDHPSTSQIIYSDTDQCTSAMSDGPTSSQSQKVVQDEAKASSPTPPPPDSSHVLNGSNKSVVAKSFSGSDPSHQGLQVPIVSSSVKGTQEENSAADVEAKTDDSQLQDKVTTSVKSGCKTPDVTLERRRGRSRTAANKQASKRQQPAEITPAEKVPKRTTSSGSSSQRTSQKPIRIVKNGDLIWGQMRGFPSWPGKVVKPSEVRGLQQRAPLSEGKVWVKWFGDHTFTQMNPADLVSMTEGLEAHHKSRRKGRTRTKKISAHLEAAIQEAVDELEQQQGTSSRRLVEAVQSLQASPVLGTVGKEQRDKPKRGRKRKGV